MDRKRPSFLHLLLYSLYSNNTRFAGALVVASIPLGYLVLLFFDSPGMFTNFFYSPAESVAMPLFIAAFSLMTAQTLMDKSYKLSILGPYKRSNVLASSIISTLIIVAFTTFLAAALLSITNYFITILAYEAAFKSAPPVIPPIATVFVSWLRRYLGMIGLFSYVVLLSFALLVWGAREFGESLNMLATLAVSFFVTLLQLDLMQRPTVYYFTFTYYMYALGSLISGLSGYELGVPSLASGSQPWTLLGIVFTFLLFSYLAWLGFQRADVGAE